MLLLAEVGVPERRYRRFLTDDCEILDWRASASTCSLVREAIPCRFEATTRKLAWFDISRPSDAAQWRERGRFCNPHAPVYGSELTDQANAERDIVLAKHKTHQSRWDSPHRSAPLSSHAPLPLCQSGRRRRTISPRPKAREEKRKFCVADPADSIDSSSPEIRFQSRSSSQWEFGNGRGGLGMRQVGTRGNDATVLQTRCF